MLRLTSFLTAGSKCAGKGAALAYRVFDKKQRVTHTAIVDNKRLSEALAWVKARQDEM